MIKKLDHYVVTTRNIEKSIEFYSLLGFKPVEDNGNYGLLGPNFIIKLHPIITKAIPLPKNVQIGCIDICFEVDENLDSIKDYLCKNGISIVTGPVKRTGFKGSMTSIYVYDPDGNLIELSSYNY